MKNIINILIVISLITGFIVIPQDGLAQTRNKRKTSKKKIAKTMATATPTPTPVIIASVKNVETSTERGEVSVPVSSQQVIEGDVQSGNVVVNVNSNGNAVIKIGLAERGVSVIDFPADDPVYQIHPGDENFVSVGCAAREQNGKCNNSPTDAIILRPGKNFHSLGSEDSASTVITVQRVSGIVVSFIVVPVKSISQNANYVVVRYDLTEVILARKKAGLTFNLQPGALAMTVNNDQNTKVELDENGQPKSENPLNTTDTNSKKEQVSENSLEKQILAELEKAHNNSSALKFSKPLYGISLARATPSDLSRVGDVSIEIVAIRNSSPQPIRLVPDQPELVIENRDKVGGAQVERINILHIVTTAEESDILAPGEIYYYAFAFNSPILGIKQVMRVSFAQREAADAPASIELGGLQPNKR